VNVVYVFVLYCISAQFGHNTTSMISLKIFKNHLSFHARFLFFFSPSRFSPLHCPLHDHWYSAK